MHQLMLYLRFSFELRTAKVMSYTIRSQSKDNSLIDCEISNLIIVNNSRLLRTTLSNLSEGKRREVLNKVDSYGNTCLGLACNNDAEGGILGILIENGALVNQPDFYGQTPLQYACLAENVEVIDVLINAGADVNFIEERYAALHTAASKGNVTIVQKLLQAGANVNILTRRGISPLHCAIESGNLDCAKALLDHGATTNFAHDLRRKSQSLAFADPLLILATGLGDIEAVKLLLNFGAKANSLNYYGMTALNVSCNRRLNKIAKILLRHGSDVNLPDRTGSIPLHYAARHGDVELVEMILKKGCQKNVLDINGESTLNHAIRSQNIEVIKLLLQYGYCTNLYNPCIKDSHPPILRATCFFSSPREFEEVLVMLVQNDCDINASVPKTYETALYKALDLRKNQIAKVLLKHNARTDVECPHGLTILNIACQRNLRDVIEFMCRLGINLNKEDWFVRGNWTCLTNQELGRSFFEAPDPSVPTIFWNKMPLYRILKNHMLSVQSLQSLCRYSIRKFISKKFQEGVNSLVLPQSLKHFLMLEDMDLS